MIDTPQAPVPVAGACRVAITLNPPDEGRRPVYCAICGDETEMPVKRFWSPDDGWTAGRLCPYCNTKHGSRAPQPRDFAYEKRGEFFSNHDEAMTTLYG